MQCRNIGNCLRRSFRNSYKQRYINNYILYRSSFRFESTDINNNNNDSNMVDKEGNILQSDEDILSELKSLLFEEMSEDELTNKIAGLNEDGKVIIDGIEYFQPSDLLFGNYLPVRTTQFVLDWMSDYMPYWIIVLSIPWITKAMITIPLTVYNARKFQERGHLIPKAMKEFTFLHNKRKEALRLKGTAEHQHVAKEHNMENKRLISKYGFNPYTQPYKQLIPVLVQMPLHFTLFIATRTMYPAYPDWKTGGLFWFSDLSVGDPYYVLPMFSALTMFLSGYSFTKTANSSKMMRNIPTDIFLYLFAATSIMYVPLAGYVFPSGLHLYIASNILSYMTQLWLMDNQKFRESMGLKPTSYAAKVNLEISKVTAELKQIDRSGATKPIQEIQGKRASKGQTGRKIKVNVNR